MVKELGRAGVGAMCSIHIAAKHIRQSTAWTLCCPRW
jgi:hypothetical protein